MKKALFLILALILCLSICACGSSYETPSVPTLPSIEDKYDQIVSYCENGQYQDALKLCQQNRNIVSFQDGQSYFDYCDAMCAYQAGGIGYAYNKLKAIPDFLDAQKTLDAIAQRLRNTNGYYTSDNAMGSYLHIVIRDGLVASEIIGYYDENQNFDYNADDTFWQELVLSSYTNGAEFLAIGRYNSLSQEIDTIYYALEFFDNSPELLVTKYVGAEYSTFNGAYTKVSEVDPA